MHVPYPIQGLSPSIDPGKKQGVSSYRLVHSTLDPPLSLLPLLTPPLPPSFPPSQEQGIATAKLPLDDLVKLDSSRVLTVNHVFDIMLQFQLCRDWSAAFLKVTRTVERCL